MMSDPMIPDWDSDCSDPTYGDASDFLSEAGRSRRDAMLPALQAAVRREGRRRRARRSAVRGLAIALAFALVGIGLVNNWSVFNNARLAQQESSPESPALRPQFVSIVRTQPGALARYRMRTEIDLNDYVVDDRNLVTTLAAIGRPAGIVRSSQGVRLTAAVTDADLTPDVDEPNRKTPNSPGQHYGKPG